MSRKKKRKGSGFFSNLLLLLCIVVFCVAAWKLWGYYNNYHGGRKEYEQLRQYVKEKKDSDKEDFEDFDILSFKKQGSVATIIIKDNDGKSKKKLEKMKPLILDYLPLTLEEVFIYEMEALGYEFNKFV